MLRKKSPLFRYLSQALLCFGLVAGSLVASFTDIAHADNLSVFAQNAGCANESSNTCTVSFTDTSSVIEWLAPLNLKKVHVKLVGGTGGDDLRGNEPNEAHTLDFDLNFLDGASQENRTVQIGVGEGGASGIRACPATWWGPQAKNPFGKFNGGPGRAWCWPSAGASGGAGTALIAKGVTYVAAGTGGGSSSRGPSWWNYDPGPRDWTVGNARVDETDGYGFVQGGGGGLQGGTGGAWSAGASGTSGSSPSVAGLTLGSESSFSGKSGYVQISFPILQSPERVVAEAEKNALHISWNGVEPADPSVPVIYTATTDFKSLSCTSSSTSCEIPGLKNHRFYSVTVSATNGKYSSEPSEAVKGYLSDTWTNGDYKDFTDSAAFKITTPGLYRVQLIGAGGQGGSQCWGWVAGGGGGGGGYAEASTWLKGDHEIQIDVGTANALGDSCVNGMEDKDGYSGSDSIATLGSGSKLTAKGGAGGHGANDNQGGAGGTYSASGDEFLNIKGFVGGHGGPPKIRASFGYGWHEGGEGGSAANSDGNGFNGTTTVCSWTARAQTGDLPAGAGGHGPSGGYGSYISECPQPPEGTLMVGQNYGAGGMGCHCGGFAGAPGYARITLVRAVAPASAPAILGLSTGDGTVTLGVDAPAEFNDFSLLGYDFSTDNGATWSRFNSVDGPFTISGLTNGILYQIKVRAVNSVGAGDVSQSVSATPTNLIPARPSIASLDSGNASTTVHITPPTDITAGSISGYEYSVNNGVTYQRATVANSAFTITGLTNGIATSVRIRAVNGNGTSLPSIAKRVIPATTPDAPIISGVTPSAGALTIAFNAPSSGGSSIQSYQLSLDGGSTWAFTRKPSTSNSIKVTGLANTSTYQVKMRAVNAKGTGSPSNLVTASTPAIAPGAPTLTGILKNRTSITVDFDAPTRDGGASITSYAFSIDGGNTWVGLSSSAVASNFVISGLKPSTFYPIWLAAVNSAGRGAVSRSFAATLR